jgi:hypothetical protein
MSTFCIDLSATIIVKARSEREAMNKFRSIFTDDVVMIKSSGRLKKFVAKKPRTR